MPDVKNNPENKLVRLFLHTTENSFAKPQQHDMKKGAFKVNS